jgi:hypothetical protein
MTDRQRRAARLLGRGLTQAEVSRVVGRSERTLRAWSSSVPGFSESVDEGRRQNKLPAAEVLEELLYSQSESIRLRAAVALLNSPVEPTAEPREIIVYAPRRQPDQHEASSPHPQSGQSPRVPEQPDTAPDRSASRNRD